MPSETALVFASPKRRRNCGPKVKTGCLTCKIRRVKCDEQKPYCARCLRTDRTCDGYGPLIVPSSPMLSSCSFRTPGSEIERKYFRDLRNRTLPDLMGYFPSRFWDYSVLQLAHHEPAVRHALLALESARSYLIDSSQESTKRFSIQQYNRAISYLCKPVGDASASDRAVLICCLLFAILENVEGHHERAMRHLECGANILLQRKEKLSGTEDTGPLSDEVDEDLAPFFSRLDIQVTSFIDDRATLLPMIVPQGSFCLSGAVPYAFSSIDQARSCQCKIMHQLFHYIHTYQEEFSISQREGTFPEGLPSNVKNMAFNLSHQLHRWSAAFDGFYARSSPNMNPFDFRAGMVLKIHQKTACLMLEVPHPTHDNEYAAIVFMARQLLPTSVSSVRNTLVTQAPASCSMDTGAVAPLYFVAMNSANPSRRQEALAVLRSSRRPEGVWGGMLVAKVARRYLQLKKGRAQMEGGVPKGAEHFDFQVEGL